MEISGTIRRLTLCHLDLVSTTPHIVFPRCDEVSPELERHTADKLAAAALSDVHATNALVQFRVAHPDTHRHLRALLDADLRKNQMWVIASRRDEPRRRTVDVSPFGAGDIEDSRHVFSSQNPSNLPGGIGSARRTVDRPVPFPAFQQRQFMPGQRSRRQEQLNIAGESLARELERVDIPAAGHEESSCRVGA